MSLTIVRDNINNKNVHLNVDGSGLLSVKDTASQSSLADIKSAVEGTIAISASALPLPSGAASAANQSSGNASLATIAGAVSGSEIQVDVITAALPSGAASSANQSTANSELAAIKTAVEGTLSVSSSVAAPSRTAGSLAAGVAVAASDFSSAVDCQNQRSVAIYGNSSNNSLQIKIYVSDDNSNFYEAQNLAIYAGGASGDFYGKWDQCARYFKIQYDQAATVTSKYTLLD